MYMTKKMHHETKDKLQNLSNQITYLHRQENAVKRQYKMHRRQEKQIYNRLVEHSQYKVELQRR